MEPVKIYKVFGDCSVVIQTENLKHHRVFLTRLEKKRLGHGKFYLATPTGYSGHNEYAIGEEVWASW